MSFGAYEEDIEGFAKRLQAQGVQRLDPPKGVDSNGLWFRDHDGNLIEIKVAPKTSPNEKADFGVRKTGVNGRIAPFRSTRPRTNPRRLAHKRQGRKTSLCIDTNCQFICSVRHHVGLPL